MTSKNSIENANSYSQLQMAAATIQHAIQWEEYLFILSSACIYIIVRLLATRIQNSFTFFQRERREPIKKIVYKVNYIVNFS